MVSDLKLLRVRSCLYRPNSVKGTEPKYTGQWYTPKTVPWSSRTPVT